jgi:hypothetical protein
MGWEQRRGGQVYYKSLRIDGRPTKVYMGKGEAAEGEALQVEQRRRECQEAREAWQSEQAEVTAAEQALQELRRLADLLVRAALLVQGYHEHRSQWRKRRDARDDNQRQGRSQG